MVCEYFSGYKDGKVICRVYGTIEVTEDKAKECQSESRYLRCFNEANQFLKDKARSLSQRVRNHPIVEHYPIAGIFNRTGFH
jgi:hypothetical protein